MDEFEREWQLLQQHGLKESDLRRAYEQKVAALGAREPELRAAGKSDEEIARTLHEARRELGRQYKLAAPPLLREYIYAATAKKYGDPLGPSFEALRQRKTYRQIIASASRPIADLDERLTMEGFRAWYAGRKGAAAEE